MKILVTGANGFIGSHLTDALLQEGHEVLAGVRRKSNLRWLEGKPVRLVTWDTATNEDLLQALQGVDQVFHVAGKTKACFRSEYTRSNVDFTRYLMEICKRLDPPPKLWVQVSNSAAAGPALGESPRFESDPTQPVSKHGLTRKQGEQVLVKGAPPFPVITLRPPVVLGPRDTELFEVLHRMSRGIFFKIGPEVRHFSWIYISDCIQGILAAAKEPRCYNQTYFLSHPDIMTWQGFFDQAKPLMKNPVKVITLPEWMIRLAAIEGNIRGWLTGKPTLINSIRVREILQHNWSCSSAKAFKDFEFNASTSLQEALQATIEWYQSMNWME